MSQPRSEGNKNNFNSIARNSVLIYFKILSLDSRNRSLRSFSLGNGHEQCSIFRQFFLVADDVVVSRPIKIYGNPRLAPIASYPKPSPRDPFVISRKKQTSSSLPTGVGIGRDATVSAA